MNFVVSSSEISNRLQSISKVISNKNTLPILNSFLFKLEGNKLVITASDIETTLITTMELENFGGEGLVAIEAKRMLDILKEFPEQPLTFNINTESLKVDIVTDKGQFSVIGQDGADYPQLPKAAEEVSRLDISTNVLLSGINKTLFATADDELRPVMNGIFIEVANNDITFVSSDAHKLVRYKRNDFKSNVEAAFILPKKPASMLKNILVRIDEDLVVEFDDKNAFFDLPNYKVICRLVEGNYPSYNSVIPTDNPSKLSVDRVELHNALRRVSVFSNQTSNLVKLSISANKMSVSGQDLDYSMSANEEINCQFEGDDIQIGFKSAFLLEILANIGSQEIIIELSDPTRAGIILPVEKEVDEEDVLMLLMPMMINA